MGGRPRREGGLGRGRGPRRKAGWGGVGGGGGGLAGKGGPKKKGGPRREGGQERGRRGKEVHNKIHKVWGRQPATLKLLDIVSLLLDAFGFLPHG